MDCGSVGSQGTQRLPGHRRLLFLPAGLSGRPGGSGTSARRCLSALSDGLGALRPRARATRGGVSRASPLLLLLLVPSPRLAAAAPRRQLGDWERSRVGYAAPLAGRSGAWRCPPGLGPGVAAAAGALPQCKGPAPALVSCRRELSLSAGYLQLERRRRDFTSSGSRRLYFDTHALVCLLEDNGFATQQAEIIVSALVKILEANMDVVYKDMVTKMQQEITFQQIMSQIANVKKDMIILEKSEFSALRAENEKVKLELHQLKQQVMYSLNEKKLLELRTEIVALHAQQDRALTQTDRKIETEVAGLKTMLESHKLDNIKYLAGSIFTCLTVALGFYRLWI
ncbi:mitochondrial calcium uniporter regulator 1 isoform X3 [Trachypithecus francoisi]|uniref:mitochondrial calcium uniporter regulator 1 isoform X3 n=1 Tax=Trachypithecus francoisi TaxID=54180 RepID=UPI00141A91CD|nr:mitochondrial calcium uniporter regulator 1 isoform X3 [Trachypithecus francoisi]